MANWDWIKGIKDDWSNRSPGLLVQLYPHADFDKVSKKIRDVLERKAPQKGIMTGWLQHYQYRAPLSWWIFAAAGAGALGITIVTVSYQAIKAALLNPVKSLRTE